MQYPKRKDIENLNYRIVSLGHNCFPRTVLTRWGLKPDRSEGELSMPFDLATFETFEITKNIQNDFENFFDNLEYREKPHFLKKEGYWIKAPDCIEFMHEKDLKKDEKQKLIDIYKKRIDNFRICLNDPIPIVFVQLLGDCDDTENLYDSLKKIRGDKPFSLVILDPQDSVKHSNPNISVLKLKYPSPDYKNNWWSQKYYTSKEGKLFEQKIADFCLEQINNLNKKGEIL